MPDVKIFIADDHVVLRDGLAGLINEFPGFRVIGMAANGEEVIADFKRGNVPEILILDLQMPKMDGFETTEQVRKDFPAVKILVSSIHGGDLALMRLLRMGIAGMIAKDVTPPELEKILSTIAEHGFYFPTETSGKVLKFFEQDNDRKSMKDYLDLTSRECLFIKLSASELTYKEVAAEMKMTLGAINRMRDQVFDKLDLQSRVGLTLFAVKNGLLS